MTLFAALCFLLGVLAAVNLELMTACDFATSPANDDGAGNVLYLDRHYVNCSNGVMCMFSLERSGTNSIKYEYFCSDLPNVTGNTVYKNTPFNDDGLGNAVFLDRHNVDCGTNSLLAGFHLRRNDNGTLIRYDYQCFDITNRNSLRCYDLTTPYMDDNGGNAIFLDRLPIACGAKAFINRFQLHRATMTDWAYRYRCCSPYP